MNDIKIESGVPIHSSSNRRKFKEILKTMAVMDSFTISNEEDRQVRNDAALACVKISIRKEGAGKRVWRIK